MILTSPNISSSRLFAEYYQNTYRNQSGEGTGWLDEYVPARSRVGAEYVEDKRPDKD